MTITTAIIITLAILVVYYSITITYDLYAARLAKAAVDEDNEEIINITDQLDDFQSIPVNNDDREVKIEQNFKNALMGGISADHAHMLMEDAANGTRSQELDNILTNIKTINNNLEEAL